MNALLFVAGLALLIFGANTLVRGASKLALSFGISPLVVGLTIVAFGTSAPEMAVSVGSAVSVGESNICVAASTLVGAGSGTGATARTAWPASSRLMSTSPSEPRLRRRSARAASAGPFP